VIRYNAWQFRQLLARGVHGVLLCQAESADAVRVFVDLGLALGYKQVPREPYPPEMQEARQRVFQACRARGIAFLETCTPESVVKKIDEGVRVIAGHREETARVGRAHTRRTMPV
jgi:hypothetical protein